ncbi:hypothetical protein D5086_002875 [Populus alba]|uniref:Uncharacterized protein n=1 Tax=Populus alba TaxID=43335 RepID=A0ACC4D322_POPAL
MDDCYSHRYSQEHVTIEMLASYLKNLPTKPMLEDDPLDSNWPFNYDMDDRRVSFENLEYLYNSSGGFLGLKTETQHPVPRTSPEINKDLNSQSASFAIGSETEPQAAKKKGEKKIRKPKYAFQTRSQVDILDDGYRWRKYGQKAVKNNKFPRSNRSRSCSSN